MILTFVKNNYFPSYFDGSFSSSTSCRIKQWSFFFNLLEDFNSFFISERATFDALILIQSFPLFEHCITSKKSKKLPLSIINNNSSSFIKFLPKY